MIIYRFIYINDDVTLCLGFFLRYQNNFQRDPKEQNALEVFVYNMYK